MICPLETYNLSFPDSEPPFDKGRQEGFTFVIKKIHPNPPLLKEGEI
ncbi:hypothetical protein OF66_0969 [Seleniivibrio woodruffii]|uniref:Uncharacterized protein n=1 Tax=Seleniivibrio woodruffii TaxID=1078050 RepID=A0A4R1KAR3_9BACT|nr:hypothetical protein C8D98_0024 [Seleniivibrio woodruffii]TVZ35359.1 hypothetical protein OF66_0969 [Seleniivibrio woodruffii]